MQTSKTDQVIIEQKDGHPNQSHDTVRNTSSAYIAVDGIKHYLHYKHFSTAEPVTRTNWQLVHTFNWVCEEIGFDIMAAPKLDRSRQVERKQATISFA